MVGVDLDLLHGYMKRLEHRLSEEKFYVKNIYFLVKIDGKYLGENP